MSMSTGIQKHMERAKVLKELWHALHCMGRPELANQLNSQILRTYDQWMEDVIAVLTEERIHRRDK